MINMNSIYKSKKEIETLEVLENYLKKNTTEPAKLLAKFWKNQQNAITYEEIREAILSEKLSIEMWKQWQQDYSILVETKLKPIWQQANKAGSLLNEERYSFVYDIQSKETLSWLQTHGAEFVRNITLEQKKAINTLTQMSISNGCTINELAYRIRPCIGLNQKQVKANTRYYETIKKQLREVHPKAKQESIEKKAQEAAIKYAEKQHRYRAQSIAQTELAFAYNKGAYLGIKQAQNQGLIGEVVKKWNTSGDRNVCSVCKALEGTIIEIEENFNFPGKELYEGHKQTPPAHPCCACAVEYIEMTLSNSNNIKPENDILFVQEEMEKQLESLTELEKDMITKYTGNLAYNMNTALNTGNNLEKYSAQILLLDNAIRKGVIPEDITVIRKTIIQYMNIFPANGKISNKDIKVLIGKELINDGFMSTSWIDFKYPGRDVYINLKVPKGYNGLYIEKIASKKYQYQKEVLLPRGLKYRITDAMMKEEIYYIEAEVII